MKSKNYFLTIFLLILIFSIAFFIRFYQLEILPLNRDEVGDHLASLRSNTKILGIPIVAAEGHLFILYTYFMLFSKMIFSSPIYIVRFPSVIIGSVTVILIYLLAKEMYGKKAGYISSLLLCFLPWHIIDSRIGGGITLQPLFGCLIFYTLLNSIVKKSNMLFILSICLLSIGSFYIYQASLLLIPIFLMTVLCLKREFCWLKPKIVFISIIISLVLIYPLFHLQFFGHADILGLFYRSYQKNPFEGNTFANLYENFKNNKQEMLRNLFLPGGQNMLYGIAFKQPLLIDRITIFILLISLSISIIKWQISDKIILSWIIVGCIGVLVGINIFQERYIFSILPAFLILIGRFISEVLDYAYKTRKEFIKSSILILIGYLLSANLIVKEIFQYVDYYFVSPFHTQECIHNSYGCKDVAKYLSYRQDLENSWIVLDERMPVFTYDYYFTKKLYSRWWAMEEVFTYPAYISKEYPFNDNSKNVIYFILWAPESHPEELWGGFFSHSYKRFRLTYPNEAPIETVYYPNGIPAINVFRIEENKLSKRMI